MDNSMIIQGISPNNIDFKDEAQPRKMIVHSSRPPLAKRGPPAQLHTRPSLNLHRFEKFFKRSESRGASSDIGDQDSKMEHKENMSFAIQNYDHKPLKSTKARMYSANPFREQ
jgi:hypothetical protein